jgi:hypothetical protein
MGIWLHDRWAFSWWYISAAVVTYTVMV